MGFSGFSTCRISVFSFGLYARECIPAGEEFGSICDKSPFEANYD